MPIDEKIAALESDIFELQMMQKMTSRLTIRNNAEGDGVCMIWAIKVLLREAISHYEEEIATLKGPEAA
jgi:uncharacterized protein with PhoU and TrkA domain